MLQRVAGLCALSLALGAAALQSQELFLLPGAGSNNAAVAAFATSPLSQITNFNSGASSFLALANPSATKFYIIADSSTQTITSIDTTFSNPTAVASLSSPATAAGLTPDGSLLAVA